MSHYIGIDLGGTNIKALAIKEDGSIVLERQIPTLADSGKEAVILRIADLISEIRRELDNQVIAVGVTLPGVIRHNEGIVELLTNFPPDQWKGYPLKSILQEHISLPFYLINDARAASYGEKLFGSGQHYHNFISLVIGTGVGGGIVLNDQLYLGSRGVAAELGHQVVVPDGPVCGCGNRGCLETVASGSAIITSAIRYIKQGVPTLMREMVQGDLNKVTAEIVSQAAEKGDEPALHILQTTASHLKTAILNMVAVLNPEAVIIGGGVAKSELLMQMLRKQLNEKDILFPKSLGGVEIVRAKFGHQAGAIGAAAWAIKCKNY